MTTCTKCGSQDIEKVDTLRGVDKGYILVCSNCEGFVQWQPYPSSLFIGGPAHGQLRSELAVVEIDGTTYIGITKRHNHVALNFHTATKEGCQSHHHGSMDEAIYCALLVLTKQKNRVYFKENDCPHCGGEE